MMDYFTEINIKRAQKAVLAQYHQELSDCVNSDLNEYYLSTLYDLSVSNPIRDKGSLIDVISSKDVVSCSETKNLLISKYLETDFVHLSGVRFSNIDFRKLTLLVSSVGSELICNRLFAVSIKEGFLEASFLSTKGPIPINSSIFQYRG
jgi:hypothetical protein